MAGVLTLPSSAQAAFESVSPDTQQIMNRLGQIENQVQTLSRSVYRGEVSSTPSGSAVPADTTMLSGYEDRLSQIDQQQRSLIGKLEEATHQIQELQNRIDKMQGDTEMRLQQLEQSRGVSSSPSSLSAAPPQPQALEVSPPVGMGGSQTLGTISHATTPDDLYDSAFSDIRDSKYENAAAKFRQFITQYPENSKAGNAQYWLSETYYVRGDYKQAAKLFAQGYQNYPKNAKAADSLLKLGLSLEKIGKKDDACLSFQQLRKQFPGESVPANRRAAVEMKQLGCT